MYALIKNGIVVKYPYWYSDLKYENPQISFPSEISNAILESFDVFPVAVVAQPSVDHTKNVIEKMPAFQDGTWTQVWHVSDASAEEVQQRTDAKAADVRSERNAKLTNSDWTQVADAPVDKDAWAAYRQALRDVTAQDGFPWTIDWPKQP